MPEWWGYGGKWSGINSAIFQIVPAKFKTTIFEIFHSIPFSFEGGGEGWG